MPIWFELSVRVVADKRAANEALLRMQHTYRPDPKCFFLQDGHAEVAGRTLDLAKLSWPRAFRAIDADSFARPCVDTPLAGFEAQALPSFALPSFALPCLALPCLPLPCLALPCLALPCLQAATNRFRTHVRSLPPPSCRSRRARPTIRPRLDDGLFFDLLRDTRLLEDVCAAGQLAAGVPLTPSARPLALFDAVRSVNDCLHADAAAKHAAGELAERTYAECRERYGGCFLGLYRRDKMGVAIISLLKQKQRCSERARCPLDDKDEAGA